MESTELGQFVRDHSQSICSKVPFMLLQQTSETGIRLNSVTTYPSHCSKKEFVGLNTWFIASVILI